MATRILRLGIQPPHQQPSPSKYVFPIFLLSLPTIPTSSYSLLPADQWSLIPSQTDILLTHGPPHSILDKSIRGDSCGCAQLSKRLLTSPPLDATGPKVHLFGHIHEAYGVEKKKGITFINGCSVNIKYKCVNKPVVFDFRAEERGEGMDVDL